MTLVITSSHSAGSSPRLRLDVASSASGPLPVVNGSLVDIFRIHEDGSRYPVITDVNARLISGSWSGFDYHAPFGQAVRYVAVAAGYESAQSAVKYLLSDTAWLIHPSDPTLSVQVEWVTDISSISRKATAARHDVFGQKARFVNGEPRKGITGMLKVLTTSVEQETAAYRLLDDDPQILVNTPFVRELTWMWVQLGDESHDSPSGKVSNQYREISYPFEETDQPDYDLSPEWTYGKIDAEFASYTVINATYTSYKNVALDVR